MIGAVCPMLPRAQRASSCMRPDDGLGELDVASVDRQPEPARPGTAGVQKDHALYLSTLGRCEWPEITSRSRGRRVEVELANVVQHVDRRPARVSTSRAGKSIAQACVSMLPRIAVVGAMRSSAG